MGTPGGSFWQFLSSISPFETWRKYLIFRHKRDQDRRYREAAEAKRLELENESRELAILEKRAKIAKQLGATKAELQPLCQLVLGRREPKSGIILARSLSSAEPRLLGSGASETEKNPRLARDAPAPGITHETN